MSQEMLIDAAHEEETRVVVLQNNQISEFDFEAENKRPLRGNIYLAKVTRVEPSLQAAFVDYGGNRHGFLAFNDIHPDYYQIPLEDREALIAAYERENAAQAAESDAKADSDSDDDDNDGETVAQIGGDALEEADESQSQSARSLLRKYKIQEVIKRRQVILVQVVKEERGNKGAALTSYLSIAGRYCVLMPNTARGGGISRKINNATDRRKLKKTVASLDVPQGMGLIIRTAGAQRTMAEVKRDYKFLIRNWQSVRDLTLASTAPALVYEDGSLIRRTIRDIYDKNFDRIIVDGEEAYREAKDYMKLMMPSHAKKVVKHKESAPLFKQSGVEQQLSSMFEANVPLPSGGYLVINQTEALVAVDVNSGKSTGEYSVEKTALNTNLEAAVELARQMRLRDLAGLIVIDFIDMDEHRNNRAVERKLKEALHHDRARIQVGRISSFGLLEMSRQRTRSGLIASSSEVCKHCQGNGFIRSAESRALQVLRDTEEAVALIADKEQTRTMKIYVPQDVCNYILNSKRGDLHRIETSHNLSIIVETDHDMLTADYRLEDENGEINLTPQPDVQHSKGSKGSKRRKNIRKEEDSGRKGNSSKSQRQQTSDSKDEEQEAKPRRRRGRRGGANRRKQDEAAPETNSTETKNPETNGTDDVKDENKQDIAAVQSFEPVAFEPMASEPSTAAPVEVRGSETDDTPPANEKDSTPKDNGKPKRRGWWSKN